MEIYSKNLENLKSFASGLSDKLEEIGSKNEQATLVCLSGNLGSGKTTLTQFVAETLGIKDSVTSPTFVIEKIYRIKGKVFEHLVHIDAYRLKDGEELISLGWEEIIKNKKNLIFLEWPENVSEVLPEKFLKIKLEITENENRKISFEL